MRIASPFQHATGPRPRRRGIGWACVVCAWSAAGCFFGLEDVVPLDGGLGGSGGGGASGEGGLPSIGGDAAVGGVGGTPVDPGCPSNEQDCGNGCVPLNVDNG